MSALASSIVPLLVFRILPGVMASREESCPSAAETEQCFQKVDQRQLIINELVVPGNVLPSEESYKACWQGWPVRHCLEKLYALRNPYEVGDGDSAWLRRQVAEWSPMLNEICTSRGVYEEYRICFGNATLNKHLSTACIGDYVCFSDGRSGKLVNCIGSGVQLYCQIGARNYIHQLDYVNFLADNIRNFTNNLTCYNDDTRHTTDSPSLIATDGANLPLLDVVLAAIITLVCALVIVITSSLVLGKVMKLRAERRGSDSVPVLTDSEVTGPRPDRSTINPPPLCRLPSYDEAVSSDCDVISSTREAVSSNCEVINCEEMSSYSDLPPSYSSHPVSPDVL